MIMSYGFESLLGNLLLYGIVIGIPIIAIIAFFVGVYSFHKVNKEKKMEPEIVSDNQVKEKRNNLIMIVIFLIAITAFVLLCNWLAVKFPK